MSQTIIVLVIVCLVGAWGGAVDSALLSLPFSVSVVVQADSVQGTAGTRLEEALESIMPLYVPGDEDDQDVELRLKYSVVFSNSIIAAYKRLIESLPTDKDGYHLLSMDDIALFVHDHLEGGDQGLHRPYPQLRSSFTNLPVLIMAAVSLPRHLIYTLSPEQCTQSAVVGVAFMDLTAKRCDLRPDVLEEDGTMVRWNSWNDWHELDRIQGSAPADKELPTARLAGVVTSAVETLAVTRSLQWRPAQETDEIFCPIVVLHCGEFAEAGLEALLKPKGANSQNNTTDEQHHVDLDASKLAPPTPDLALIRDWLRSALLPNHSVSLLHASHHVDDHPQVTVALSHALKAHLPSLSRQRAAGASAGPDAQRRGGGAGETTRMESAEEEEEEGEAVPFIDSALFIRELRGVGDALTRQLLSKGGQEEAVAALMAAEVGVSLYKERSINDLFKDLPFGGDVDGDGDIEKLQQGEEEKKKEEENKKAEGGAAKDKKAALVLKGGFKKKHLRRVHMRVVPVFVLSGLQRLVQVAQNKPSPSSSSAGKRALPVMPLLDGLHHVVVTDDCVLILHSSEPVRSRSVRRRRRWGERQEAYDLDSAVAAGLTEALTGLRAPHLQQLPSTAGKAEGRGKAGRRALVDLTWTHGNHPFAPFSVLHASPPKQAGGSERREDEDEYKYNYRHRPTWQEDRAKDKESYTEEAGVLSWAAKRSVLLARVHQTAASAKQSWRRGAAILDRVQEAFTLLQGPPSSEMRSYGGVQVSASLAMALPAAGLSLFVALQAELNHLARALDILVDSFAHDADNVEIRKTLAVVEEFQAQVTTRNEALHDLEAALFQELRGCRFHFDGEEIPSASKPDKKRSTYRSYFSAALQLVGGVAVLGAAALLLARVQSSVQRRAKKIA